MKRTLIWSGWPDLNRRYPAPKAGDLTKLAYIPMKYLNEAFLACLEGLEPSAFRLGGGRSILLSYRHKMIYAFSDGT